MEDTVKLFEKLMNAVTFAEAGLPDVAVEMLNETEEQEAAGPVAGELKVVKTGPSVSDRIDRIQEAATFAEAGEHGYAREAMAAGGKDAPSLLVVSHDDLFSEKLRSHSLDLAIRMGYGIVAMNVMETPRGESLRRETATIAERFRWRAEQNIAPFRMLAEGRGVTLRHVVMEGSVEEAIRDAHRTHGGLELVVSDPASLGEKDLPAESVSVFTLAPHRA